MINAYYYDKCILFQHDSDRYLIMEAVIYLLLMQHKSMLGEPRVPPLNPSETIVLLDIVE